MKKLISLILVTMMVASIASSLGVTVGAVTRDPSLDYTVQTAPNEDSQIQMWFNHANVKVHQEDTTSTGRNTYSVYMAKNEYQGTQVTLYSESATKQKISANITSFTGMEAGNAGATMSAEVFYEYYINCENLDVTDVLGVGNAEDSFIREGMIPDAMAPISDINFRNGQNKRGTFTLTAGLTQTLYIKIKSELDTPSGWYSGQFNVIDSENNVIKTATVYAYVWDFEIPEAIHYQTAFYLDYGDTYRRSEALDTVYKNRYDYLLDNRLCAFNVPGDLNSSNEYITNPRVTAFRVADVKFYLGLYDGGTVGDIYADLSQMDDWDTIKDKVYFYVADEPRSQQQKDNNSSIAGSPTVADLRARYNTVANNWADPYVLVAIDENHPYPAGYSKTLAYNSATGTYTTYDDKSGRFDNIGDAIQGMMNEGTVTLWCMKSDIFTPHSVIEAVGYTGARRETKVKNMNGIISGFDCTRTDAYYFDWDTKYGEFADRFAAFKAQKAANGVDEKLWFYECGKGPDYTYCNHLVENTGLQTELLFWQSMQLGCTGYLYYGVNLWTENGTTASLAPGSSQSCDGSMIVDEDTFWSPNKHHNGDAPGTYIYGNGVLFYERSAAKVANTSQPLGTIRVEQMRDGIEDYEMLYQYREIYGEEAMQNFIKKVSNNVVDYLSMPSFSTAAYSSSMTDEDIFAAVRIELGNAIENPKTEPKPEFAPGDVNCDTHITAHDLADLKCALVGHYGEGVTFESCDVNRDGSVNSHDVEAIKHIFVS